jgi:hypothetical protein
MKSSSKPTVSSSDDSPKRQSQNKRQEQAFIASGRHAARSNESRIDELSRQQFMLFNKLGGMEGDITRTIKDVRTDLEAKAAQELEKATENIDGKVKNLENDLNKKVLEARNKIIEPLAIFVGLFTFTSIGFQVFTQVKEYILWMPILGAVLGGLIIFAGLVVHASSVNADTKERRKYTGFIMGLGTLILLSSGAYYYKAVDVLRAEDSKTCILVQSSDQDAPAERYCKLAR